MSPDVHDALHTLRLDNGFTLVAERIADLESAALSLVSPAGSCRDTPDLGGLASLTCEMMLRGAGDRSSREFMDELDSLGVDRGESVSAGAMNFGGAVLGSSLPAALRLYADLVRSPRLPEEELEAGRAVLLQEIQSIEDEPAQRCILELRRALYAPPWGEPSHGEIASVERITAEDVRGFYRKHVGPADTVLAVAGSFDWDELSELVHELFGDWRSDASASPRESLRAPAVVHSDDESQQTHIAVAMPCPPYRDPDYFQAWGAAGVLGGGSSSRLFTEVREKRGLCYSVYASTHTLQATGSIVCYSGTSAERAQETLDVIVAELRRLREGVTAAELDRLKSRIKSSLIMQQESSSARAASIARDWRHLGRVRSLQELGDLVDAVTPDSINDYLARRASEEIYVATLGPQPLELH